MMSKTVELEYRLEPVYCVAEVGTRTRRASFLKLRDCVSHPLTRHFSTLFESLRRPLPSGERWASLQIRDAMPISQPLTPLPAGERSPSVVTTTLWRVRGFNTNSATSKSVSVGQS